MVDLVDMLVQWTGMKRLVSYSEREIKVSIPGKNELTTEVKEILEEEEEENLGGHGLQRREWYMVGLHAKAFGSGVKQPNLNKINYPP